MKSLADRKSKIVHYNPLDKLHSICGLCVPFLRHRSSNKIQKKKNRCLATKRYPKITCKNCLRVIKSMLPED